ncbi:glutamine synthetase, mitochondrial [Ixodes scapularis]
MDQTKNERGSHNRYPRSISRNFIASSAEEEERGRMASAKPEILRKYLDLEQPDDVVFVTYVFVDGTLENVRAKTRTLAFEPKTAKNCPEWTYCAVGTYQWADAGAKSEMFLVPVALFKDPFLKGRNKLVLCETLLYDRRPPETNTRRSCEKTMKEAANQDPWFGIEQEYVLLDADKIPLGWPKDNNVIRPLGSHNRYPRSISRNFIASSAEEEERGRMASAKPEILRKYLDLEQPDDVVFVTYVFVDGTLENVRAKTRTLAFEPKTAKNCPEWTYCAVGTYQWADAGAKSEMFLVPVALFKDPFLKGRNKLVLCETLLYDRRPPDFEWMMQN